MQKHEQLIYNGLQEVLGVYLSGTRNALLVASYPLPFLNIICDNWDEYLLVTRIYSQILLYFDRTYLKQYNKPSVTDMCLQKYKDFLLDTKEDLMGRIVEGLLDRMDSIRTTSDDSCGFLIRRLIALLWMLSDARGCESIFREVFFEKYIFRLEQYYSDLAVKLIDSFGFVKTALNAFEMEPMMVLNGHQSNQYLRQRISDALVSAWITPHYHTVVKSFLTSSASLEALRGMYMLFKWDKAASDFFQSVWLNELESKVSPSMEIIDLIEFLKTIYSQISSAFSDDHQILFATNSLLEGVLNADEPVTLSRKLALHMDGLLRERNEVHLGSESLLNDSVLIFRLIASKDVFESFGCLFLARRLLGGKSNINAEMEVTSRLKMECGPGYTAKMEAMIQDVLKSSNLVKYAKILTTGVWPIKPGTNKVKWPPVMQSLIGEMERDYSKKFSGRLLSWSPCYGSIEMHAKLASGEYTWTMSTLQGMILLVMDGNKDHGWTVGQLAEFTGVDSHEIKRHVLSLTTKHKVLLKEVYDGQDTFRVNQNFTANYRFVKLPLIADNQLPANENPSAVPSTVDEDRKHSTEAAIVRIMKARKKLESPALLAEVTNILKSRFVPANELVQNRIRNLIEREFIRHSIEDNVTWYYYVA